MKFDWYRDYDKYIKKICPNYNKVLYLISKKVNNNVKLTELGCGTGNLTKNLISNKQNLKLTIVDKDKYQLNICKNKLKNNLISYVCQDVLKTKFTKNDVVISSLLFHLLPKTKRHSLFNKLCNAKIKTIIIFDRILGETKIEEQTYRANWKSFLLKNKLPKELISQLLLENKSNFPDKLTDQIAFFESKGYICKVLFKPQKYGFLAYSFIKK